MKKEALHYLYHIGLIDKEVFQLEKEKKELPGEIEELSKDKEKLEKEINEIKEKIVALENEIPEVEKELEEAEKGYKKAEEKLAKVTTNKDYDLAYEERTKFKQRVKYFTNRKDEILLEIEESKELLKQKEDEYENLIKEVDPLIKKKKNEIKKIEKEIEKKLQRKEELLNLLKEVDVKLERLYRTNFKIKKNQLVIGFISEETSYCSNCFNTLPLQTIYDINKGAKVKICENCGVILVSENFKELDEEKDEIKVNESKNEE